MWMANETQQHVAQYLLVNIHWDARTSITAIWGKTDTLLDEGKHCYNNHLHDNIMLSI